jgi:hypothetical protein
LPHRSGRSEGDGRQPDIERYIPSRRVKAWARRRISPYGVRGMRGGLVCIRPSSPPDADALIRIRRLEVAALQKVPARSEHRLCALAVGKPPYRAIAHQYQLILSPSVFAVFTGFDFAG